MIVGIIPARYASTRYPGKPLIDIQGKSMIQRVYEQASKSKSLDRVVVATDDEGIHKHVAGFGGEVVMTAEDHPSGTDRCSPTRRPRMPRGFNTVIERTLVHISLSPPSLGERIGAQSQAIYA